MRSRLGRPIEGDCSQVLANLAKVPEVDLVILTQDVQTVTVGAEAKRNLREDFQVHEYFARREVNDANKVAAPADRKEFAVRADDPSVWPAFSNRSLAWDLANTFPGAGFVNRAAVCGGEDQASTGWTEGDTRRAGAGQVFRQFAGGCIPDAHILVAHACCCSP